MGISRRGGGENQIFTVTDSTDIALPDYTLGYSAVGAAFNVNVKDSSVIRLLVKQGRTLNDASAGARNVVLGLRIDAVNFWCAGTYNNNGTSGNSPSTSFPCSNLAAGFYERVTSGEQIASLLSKSSDGLPTGYKSVQVIAGWVSFPVTLKGTVLQTKVIAQVM